ncbi:MAG TPA: branched-chain amino acid ABC transporter permease [bacterium]|nr:branched-chain amino acid ABC transporter permease [bacterium]
MNHRVGVLLGIAAVALLLLPQVASPTVLHLAVIVCFYAFLGQAWNILGGYAGQFSFGHAAFFGIGAYTSTLLYLHLGVSPWLGMLAAGVAGMAFGLVSGFLSFRYGLRGPYFALVMLAFAEMLRIVAENWGAVGGSVGVLVPLLGSAPLQFQFASKRSFYYIILALLAGATLLVWRIGRSRLGYYLLAIRENEEAAEALGVNAFRYKMAAMAISAFLTAMGGTFYAQYLLYIDPEITFGTTVSIEILLRPVIGGAGTVFGPILGSLVLTPFSEIAKSLFRGFIGVHLMIFGAILVAVIIFLPQGIMGLLDSLWRRYGGGGGAR